ncbi:MAG TPA: YtxH domain-containing protein [Acidobacteriaceae bacterium]|jgi:gas vesicle protein|nr:YtxH domain-containing protein [Acidobacteriaceae bacterium]
MSDENSSGSGIGWFLAGLGLGALLGVLYAPKAGKETREEILSTALDAKQRATELVEKGRQQAGEYVDRGKEYYERGRTQWSQYVDKGRGYVGETAEKLSAAVEAGKHAYQTTTTDTDA